MDNSYFTQVAPYFQQLSAQDQANLNPVFQNIGGQQSNENAALQQQMQNNQAAGQAFQQGGGMGGLSPLAMAAALRKPNYDQWQTTGDNTYFGANSNGQGAGLSPDMLNTLGLK